MRHGKHYRAVLEKIDRERHYDLGEAVALIKDNAGAKFDESVEVAMNLGVDPRHADQMVRGTVNLPHGTGKMVRVLVFAKGEQLLEAQEAGADFAGSEELVEKVKGGWFGFDVVVASPDMMRDVGKLGSLLGPRKLMPSPKAGTVTNDIVKTVKELKAGKIEFRVEKNGIIHSAVGKVSFSAEQLLENLQAVVEAVMRARPAASKGTYLKNLTISTTMGPGVKIDKSTFT